MTALISIELEALAGLDNDEENSQLPSLNNKYDSLLGSEPNSLGINPCLDILLSENILSHVLGSSRMPITPDQQDSLRLEQLKLYETLLDQSSARAQSLLSHQPFLKPLLELLNECCKGILIFTLYSALDSKVKNFLICVSTFFFASLWA